MGRTSVSAKIATLRGMLVVPAHAWVSSRLPGLGDSGQFFGLDIKLQVVEPAIQR
jgi:hypothetical protein